MFCDALEAEICRGGRRDPKNLVKTDVNSTMSSLLISLCTSTHGHLSGG